MEYSPFMSEIARRDDNPDITVPTMLKGIRLPQGDRVFVQQQIDILWSRMQRLGITYMHWGFRGIGTEGPTIDEVHSHMDEIGKNSESPLINVTAIPVSPRIEQ